MTVDNPNFLPRVGNPLPPHLDPTRSELAFEERMFPKLNSQMKSDSINDRQKALKSLTDISHNQQKAYELFQLGLLDTVGNILKDPDDLCREFASEIFSVLCSHNIGRNATLKFIPQLAELFSDKNITTRRYVHKTLYFSSELITGVSEIIKNKLVPTFISLLKTEDDVVRCWIIQTLHKCLRFSAEDALENNGLKTLKGLLDSKNEIIVEFALRSLAEITSSSNGKVQANEDEEIINLLVKIIRDSTVSQLRAAAACAIASVSITTKGKRQSVKAGVLDPLCAMLTDKESEGRLMALTALSICGEVPEGRQYLLKRLDPIKALLTDKDPLVSNAARECLEIIQWKP